MISKTKHNMSREIRKYPLCQLGRLSLSVGMTDQHTDRRAETYRQTDRHTASQTYRQADWQTDTGAGGPKDKQTGRPTDHYTDRQADRKTGRQTDWGPKGRQVGRPTYRQVGRERETSYPETKAIISFLSARRPQEDVSVNEWTLKTCEGKAVYVILRGNPPEVRITRG